MLLLVHPRGAGSPGQGGQLTPLKFEIVVKNGDLGYVERVIFDIDPLLKNGSRAPGTSQGHSLYQV